MRLRTLGFLGLCAALGRGVTTDKGPSEVNHQRQAAIHEERAIKAAEAWWKSHEDLTDRGSTTASHVVKTGEKHSRWTAWKHQHENDDLHQPWQVDTGPAAPGVGAIRQMTR